MFRVDYKEYLSQISSSCMQFIGESKCCTECSAMKYVHLQAIFYSLALETLNSNRANSNRAEGIEKLVCQQKSLNERNMALLDSMLFDEADPGVEFYSKALQVKKKKTTNNKKKSKKRSPAVYKEGYVSYKESPSEAVRIHGINTKADEEHYQGIIDNVEYALYF